MIDTGKYLMLMKEVSLDGQNFYIQIYGGQDQPVSPDQMVVEMGFVQ